MSSGSWARILRVVTFCLVIGAVLPGFARGQVAADGVDPALFQAVKTLVGAVDQATRHSVPKLRAQYVAEAEVFYRACPGGILPPNAPLALTAVLLGLRVRLKATMALARQEKTLQSEMQRVLRLFEAVRREGEGSTAPRVRLLLGNTRQRLAQIRSSHAFEELRFPFIRSALRSTRRDLEEARKRSASGGQHEEELRRLEKRFETLRDRSAGEPRVWAVLRRGLQVQQRARAALKKGETELLRSHLAQFAALVKQAEGLLVQEEGQGKGLEEPARQSLEACRELGRRLTPILSASPLGERLLQKGLELEKEASEALRNGNARRCLERARLARRIFERARREVEAGR